jgi:hypothetical protein
MGETMREETGRGREGYLGEELGSIQFVRGEEWSQRKDSLAKIISCGIQQDQNSFHRGAEVNATVDLSLSVRGEGRGETE